MNVHAPTGVPCPSVARFGCTDVPLSLEMSTTSPKDVPRGRAADWIRGDEELRSGHAATAVPLASIVTFGSAKDVLSVGPEIAAGVPNDPPDVREAASTAQDPPAVGQPFQTATALLLLSTATREFAPLMPSAETSSTADPIDPSALSGRDWMRVRVPSGRSQTTVVRPVGSIATSGFAALPPPSERSRAG